MVKKNTYFFVILKNGLIFAPAKSNGLVVQSG